MNVDASKLGLKLKADKLKQKNSELATKTRQIKTSFANHKKLTQFVRSQILKIRNKSGPTHKASLNRTSLGAQPASTRTPNKSERLLEYLSGVELVSRGPLEDLSQKQSEYWAPEAQSSLRESLTSFRAKIDHERLLSPQSEYLDLLYFQFHTLKQKVLA